MNLVDDLISTYRAPSPKMVEQMQMMVRKIPERFHEEIYQAIIEEEGPNILIGVNHIVSACERIGAPYTKAHYLPTEDWTCDACEHHFKYHPAPSDDDKIDKGIHDVCPKCGFQVCWSKDGAALKLRFGKYPEWYNLRLKQHRDNPRPWDCTAATEDRAKERRVKVDAQIGEIDRARRWDEDRD
jgi:hypothetical protein